MSNGRRYVNAVLRYVAGGTGRGLRMMRRMRRDAKKRDRHAEIAGNRSNRLAKFARWVRNQIPQDDVPEKHIHPRHERDPKFLRPKKRPSRRRRSNERGETR